MSEPTQHSMTGANGQGAAHEGDMPTTWALRANDHSHAHSGYQPTALDWGIVGLAVVILIVSLVMTVRYLFRPGETGEDHIKRRILHDGGPL